MKDLTPILHTVADIRVSGHMPTVGKVAKALDVNHSSAQWAIRRLRLNGMIEPLKSPRDRTLTLTDVGARVVAGECAVATPPRAIQAKRPPYPRKAWKGARRLLRRLCVESVEGGSAVDVGKGTTQTRAYKVLIETGYISQLRRGNRWVLPTATGWKSAGIERPEWADVRAFKQAIALLREVRMPVTAESLRYESGMISA